MKQYATGTVNPNHNVTHSVCIEFVQFPQKTASNADARSFIYNAWTERSLYFAWVLSDNNVIPLFSFTVCKSCTVWLSPGTLPIRSCISAVHCHAETLKVAVNNCISPCQGYNCLSAIFCSQFTVLFDDSCHSISSTVHQLAMTRISRPGRQKGDCNILKVCFRFICCN